MIKAGDKVKFKTSYGWNGYDPWFYGEIKNHNGRLMLYTEEFEEKFIELDDKYIKDITVIKELTMPCGGKKKRKQCYNNYMDERVNYQSF